VTGGDGFPEGFMWGTAASSTQTEGAAPRSDWAAWEAAGRAPASGAGNGFGTDHADDFALFASLGLTHHRLSLDWARLEPWPGQHDRAAVEHYRSRLTAARDAGLSVWACLHHFTLPGWFADDEGGFLDQRGRTYFWARHVDWVAETFGDLVHGWKPVNEPVAYAFGGWMVGEIPPGRADVGLFAEALEATLLANHEAWRLLRSGEQPTCTIFNLSPVHAAWPSGDERERAPAQANARLFDDVIWRSWTRALTDGVLSVPGRPERVVEDMAGSFDLIGFSYYNALSVHADLSTGPFPADARTGPLGYAPWAEGLGVVLRRLADDLPGRPLVVAECGLGSPTRDDDDAWRAAYLDECLGQVRDALADGVDVRGFFHWTGVDNYEWTHGFDVAFGLIDRSRNPKGSAEVARRWATAPAAED
jgi:beta-glucosidase